MLGILVTDADDQRGFVQRVPGRARIEPDFADLDVVAFLGRNDGQRVVTVAQRAGRESQGLGEVLFGDEQLAQFASVEFHGPIQFHVALPDEERVFVGIVPGGELEIEPAAVGRFAGELLPFRVGRGSEVIKFWIENALWLGDRRGGGAERQCQGQPPIETTHDGLF